MASHENLFRNGLETVKLVAIHINGTYRKEN